MTQSVPATPFTAPGKTQVRALGSGFVLDKQGDIATNDHVVQGATAIRVGFSDGASYPTTVVGTDPSTDLAVVRVQAPASATRIPRIRILSGGSGRRSGLCDRQPVRVGPDDDRRHRGARSA